MMQEKQEGMGGVQGPENEAQPRKSYVSQGKEYEEHCQSVLIRMGATAHVVGKACDGGIDIIGHLTETKTGGAEQINLVAQCKSSRAKVPVQLIREFEGVLGRENSGVVGFFFSPSGFSQNSLNHGISSKFPLALCTTRGEFTKIWQNPVLRKMAVSLRPPARAALTLCPSSRQSTTVAI